MRIVYKSNGGPVGAGLRPTRISGSGDDQTFAILVDEKAERYSEVTVADPKLTEINVANQSELDAAIASADESTVIVLAPGNYRLFSDQPDIAMVRLKSGGSTANINIEIT